ncbi:MAG: DeoR/GlpR family DNA-binding transcription regulator [Spirochaetales bacterium]|nr:DeoR/GlpR family DNA-binding transcription regulator [Spirochaetales bacterium]MCF7939128.1 DeoR/GlpR family DNA-binding transcription regulator [Spirochaetales bacterium]
MNTENEKPVFAEERKIAIVEYVENTGSVTISDLCRRFDVSPATIRNDLRELERQARLIRTHGGAMRRHRTGYETRLENRTIEQVEKKQIIANLALECVESGDTILLDVGTTTYELATVLGSFNNLQIVTNDLKIAYLADEYPNVLFTVLGGQVRSGYHSMVGSSVLRELEDFAVDRAFMGTNAFEIGYGASTPDPGQAEVKKKMLKIATKNYLLCDSTKIGGRSFVRFATMEELDVLVTDQISSEDLELLENSGIEVRAGRVLQKKNNL